MNTIERLKIRSMAAVDAWLYKTGIPNWSTFNLKKAVDEGYIKNGWVYRAVSLIARNGSSVPWIVIDEKGEKVENHYINELMKRPNKEYSCQDMMELIITWHQLVGSAFLQRVFINGKTNELWPISPSRIAPIGSEKPGELIKGYAISNTDGDIYKISSEYTKENVIHFRMLDPSDPISGIGPLQAAARAVDVDSEQQNWNKAAMENRGVFDGVFTFKSPLSASQYDGILQKIKERFSGKENARTPGVVGGDASYTRMSVTPAEMDFINSRKFNREEIFIIFGVPLPLAGASDAMTYNNYLSSMRIFWENTIIPLLDDIADTLNTALYNELNDGKLKIAYDISEVAALREGESNKADIASKYWKIGVPVEKINNKIGLGLDEFEGWDKPWGGKPAPKEEEKEEKKRSKKWNLIPYEKRSIKSEQDKRDRWAEDLVKPIYERMLNDQLNAVLKALDSNGEPLKVVSMDGWKETMETISYAIAIDMAGTTAINDRGDGPKLENRDEFDDAVADLIKKHMEEDGWLEKEVQYIEEFTLDELVDLLKDASENGFTVQQIKTAIQDMGIFSPVRALRLARTLAGTAASIGQLSGAEASGAETKTWINSGFEVRKEHVNRHNEEVGIDEKFSSQGCGKPKYPLDPILCPKDRVNCRCSLVFS